MPGNDYHFITRWRVQGTREEVYQVLDNAPDLVRWWPSVYLEVQELEPGDERGLGKVVRLHTKGWLPYTLYWCFRVTAKCYPSGYSLQAWGDFAGQGVWTFEQDGPWVNATYDWRVRADKPLLRYLSWVLKPVFAANHRWAMARGEQSLRLELARRHAATPEARGRIPAPPRPTTLSHVPLLLGLGGVAAAAAGLVYLLCRTLA
jgi:hypothetical protein